MKIIEIEPLENGAYRNQEFYGSFPPEVPQGWAVIPEDMTIPETFPFVNIEVEDGVVISMTAGVVPEPEPLPEPPPTEMEQLRADLDYIALRMGVTL